MTTERAILMLTSSMISSLNHIDPKVITEEVILTWKLQ